MFLVTCQGHSDGGKKLAEFLQWCMDAGVAMVTAFAFSTENWKRDKKEVSPQLCIVSDLKLKPSVVMRFTLSYLECSEITC